MQARAGEGLPKPGPCGVSGEARERGSEPFTHRAQRRPGVLVPRHVCGPLWFLIPLKPDAAADPAGLGSSRDILPCQLLASLTYSSLDANPEPLAWSWWKRLGPSCSWCPADGLHPAQGHLALHVEPVALMRLPALSFAGGCPFDSGFLLVRF